MNKRATLGRATSTTQQGSIYFTWNDGSTGPSTIEALWSEEHNPYLLIVRRDHTPPKPFSRRDPDEQTRGR